MEKEAIEQILRRLKTIPWGEANTFTSKAEGLAKEHVTRMRAIIEEVRKARGLLPEEIYAETQVAGHNAPDYGPLMDALFDMRELRGVAAREHVILALTSRYFWRDDPYYRVFANPWESVEKLYELGFLSSFEEDEATQKLNVVFFCQSDYRRYCVS